MWSVRLGPVRSPERMRDYVNFYAYLHKRSDEDMGTVLDALEADKGLWERTIVIRLSDHGEMGLAHGGMREKAYNAYEETMHVPLVVANPKLFPKPLQTDCLASTVDLMPTLAGLAGRPEGRRLGAAGTRPEPDRPQPGGASGQAGEGACRTRCCSRPTRRSARARSARTTCRW